VCEQRDPKGLYKKARQGVISDFTGVDAVYEEPLDADVVVDTQNHCVSECVIQLISALKRKGFV
jgi:adenylylsulfate kinase